ncbi:MAG TPA: hypothetical protein PK926_05085 [Spirochaetota bacterium]|nr:hypothetical protein [Spirochaetota bacterium]HPI88163.1 hypothetical protein [Spirochaetota bacterium]HPR47938.1 hypothetical protein [Spirochaetota bacterium]
MEAEQNLFNKEHDQKEIPQDIPGRASEDKRIGVSFTDDHLKKLLIRYIRSYNEFQDKIEVKGMLIDFIRKI